MLTTAVISILVVQNHLLCETKVQELKIIKPLHMIDDNIFMKIQTRVSSHEPSQNSLTFP